MSTDAQKVIAAVLAKHERTGPPSECRVKHDYGCCEECGCGCVMAYGDWVAHVSAEVDAALGGLTLNHAPPSQVRCSCTHTGLDHMRGRCIAHKRDKKRCECRAFDPQHRQRWVGGWTPDVR